MTVAIRELGPNDIDLWVRLRHRMWPEHDAADLAAEIRAWSGPDLGQFRGWVAEEDGTAVGIVELGLRHYADACAQRPAAFLELIWVAPEARRRGLGRRLVDHVAAVAAREGRVELGSDALSDNVVSHAAHRAWGFGEVKRVVYFRRQLV